MACENCPMRRRFEQRPKSLIGRIWFWHTRWCPGWKRWVASLDPAEREALLSRIRALRDKF